eukprot:488863-Amphidinium_carterae.1
MDQGNGLSFIKVACLSASGQRFELGVSRNDEKSLIAFIVFAHLLEESSPIATSHNKEAACSSPLTPRSQKTFPKSATKNAEK